MGEDFYNKRIAKNTLLLYTRTLLVMCVSLFTSRVILQTLGIDDFGIYNVIGGVVSMFSVLTGALSNAISRFITFELGRGCTERLIKIFSTSVNIQIVFSFLILFLGETVGLWFLNTKMNIPIERLSAANWVFQCSLLTFVVNLLSVPYNAAIIAHERMSAFAYVSILEVSLKLAVAYLLYLTPWDKLAVYSVLLVLIAIIIRFTYRIYCNKHFEETKYQLIYDRGIIKEMSSFAGWNFLSNAAYLFNTQGVNILINIFFGVGFNAARGIATQVESAIMKFVTDFTTAINPQITKNYAQGNMDGMCVLVCKGAKFSYFLLLFLSLPVLLETDFILYIWLDEVPSHTSTFIRLTILGTMIDRLLFTGYTACMATGEIKKYVITITSIGCLVFPLTYVVFKLGAPVEATYVVFAFIYIFVNIARLSIMKQLLHFPVKLFLKEVIANVSFVTIASIVFPMIIVGLLEPSFQRLIISITSSFICVATSVFLIGLNRSEQKKIKEIITNIKKIEL